MKLGWLILLLACAMATAMVPRMRRSQPTEESKTICAPTTSCGWSIYNSKYKIVEMNITNNYCICSADTICGLHDDDSTSTLTFRCVKPTTPKPDESDDSGDS